MVTARDLTASFAERSGLVGTRPQRRYLWTDAFVVCNSRACTTSSVDIARTTRGAGGPAGTPRQTEKRSTPRLHGRQRLARTALDFAVVFGVLAALVAIAAPLHPTLVR